MSGARALAACLLFVAAAPAGGQARPDLHVRAADAEWRVTPGMERGYAVLAARELERMGWSVARDELGATMAGPGGARVRLRAGTPFFHWNESVLQLADAPYVEGGELRVPLQLATDFLPERLPETYTFDATGMVLEYAGSSGGAVTTPEEVAAVPPVAAPPEVPAASVPAAADFDPEPPRSAPDGPRVVVIDAGHGGDDPGSISRSGVQEKAVALGVALAIARALEGVPGLEVHLLRDSDRFIPLWDRGTIATQLKGERPGIFVSVHANSFNSPARGFETYFLSDARTEHERRVAAIENAPIAGPQEAVELSGDLDFILRELKNLDTQHWSALLAELVQNEMAAVHPGPNRGVKQAPLAVITNALMPAVLVEVGYLSHPEEARLLGRPDFQEQAGAAVARAIASFFERYPPRTGGASGAGR